MNTDGMDRRTFLKSATISSLGVGLAGCSDNTDGATPVNGQAPAGLIRRGKDGYYSWFASGNTGFRSKEPFAYLKGDSRWMAEVTPADGVRCLVKNVKLGTAGFELPLGKLGTIEQLAIGSRAETRAYAGEGEGAGAGGGADAEGEDDVETELFYALYFDRDENETYYNWSTDPIGRQTFQGYGKDLEGVGTAPAGEPLTIGRGTELQLPKDNSLTLRKLQNGEITGIGESTPTALFVGVLGRGAATRVAVIESLAINRR